MKVIALDIGGSSIKAGTIAKENGFYSKVLYEETVKLNTNEFFELKEKIFDICERLIDSKDVNVIGISTAGSVDNNGMIWSPKVLAMTSTTSNYWPCSLTTEYSS